MNELRSELKTAQTKIELYERNQPVLEANNRTLQVSDAGGGSSGLDLIAQFYAVRIRHFAKRSSRSQVQRRSRQA